MDCFSAKAILISVFLFFSSAEAQEIRSAKGDDNLSHQVISFEDSLSKITEEQNKKMEKLLSKEKSIFNRKIDELESIIEMQSVAFDSLTADLNSRPVSDGMSFEEWAGILLASVAIILTVLAVVIALVSFYGYRKIISSANEIATNKSIEIASCLVKEKIHETTKIELVNLFEGNKLDDFLLEAAGKVIYRGISRVNHVPNADGEDDE